MSGSYENTLDEALSDLAALLQRRREIDKRISGLRDIILVLWERTGSSKARREKLMALFGHLDVGVPRLTDGVKDALYAAHPRRLPAVQVMDLMELRGFNFTSLTNPLASVHSTLRRLAAQGEVGSGSKMGAAVYWWTGPHWGARNSLANVLADRELSKQMNAKIRERVNRRLAEFGIDTQE